MGTNHNSCQIFYVVFIEVNVNESKSTSMSCSIGKDVAAKDMGPCKLAAMTVVVVLICLRSMRVSFLAPVLSCFQSDICFCYYLVTIEVANLVVGGTATAGSDVVQSGRPIFDDFFQHLWPYIGNDTANVVFQMVKRLWLIHIDQ
ncbi:hypothetical protein TNCV_4387881 [Trichonephila clavipes]|nr:hypothetical protein TNCV_4387881 [Trichonephila clavipes]